MAARGVIIGNVYVGCAIGSRSLDNLGRIGRKHSNNGFKASFYEANRFIRPNYKIPYWNGKGGDTKAEENSWDAMALQQALLCCQITQTLNSGNT